MVNLPAFPEFRPVCLSDRELIENLFRQAQPEISELTFTNLFMFRHIHDYSIAVLDGSLVIYARSYSGKPYFLPPIGGDEKRALGLLIEYQREKGEEPAVELAWKGFVERHAAGDARYEYEPDRDNSDYVYLVEDLATLSGRKYHDKKNLLNRFLKGFPDHEYVRLTPELVPEARDLVVRWCDEKCSLEVPSTFGETEATLLALDHMDRLSATFGAVKVNGKVEAIAVGEELNRDTAVIHVEKANAAYAGLYQFISSQFLAREFADYKYVNREQDLGEPNLRKSKLSYNPARMVEKYSIKLTGR